MSSQHLPADLKLGFIGAGNMARSLIGGLINQGFTASNIVVSDPSPECQQAARELGADVLTANSEIIAAVDVVVLAVKPQVMSGVLQPLASSLAQHRPLIISIAAGISCQSISSWSNAELPIVRCMPNTPALVQTGATGLFANVAVSSQQKQLAQSILEAVGIARWVAGENELDAVTALSGSGPAYFFLLMEQMQKSAEKLGLDADTASALTLQTALGAAKMALQSDVDLAELRRQVTSPNGTTEAAIQSFVNGGMEKMVDDALQAANQRSVELASELG